MGDTGRAILIGYFNPFHTGHGYLVLEGIKLVDELLIYVMSHVPADYKPVASLHERQAIIKKWIKNNKGKWAGRKVEVYGGKSTPKDLFKSGYCTIQLLGADRFIKKDLLGIDELIKEFIVVGRAGFEMDKQMLAYCAKRNKKVVPVSASKNGLEAKANSTDIRESILKKEPISGLVPREVEEDIKKIGIYKASPMD